MKPNPLKTIFLFSLLLVLTSCEPAAQSTPANKANDTEIEVPRTESTSTTVLSIDTSLHCQYPWLATYEAKDILVNQVAPPNGFQRIEVPKHSFADWLRHLPLKEASAQVHHFDGTLKGNQSVHHGVINIDTGKRDLQQCADAVMRLKAAYHYSQAEYDQIHFNYTSGDRVSFDDWRKGRKPKVAGNRVVFSSPQGNPDNSHRNFHRYLRQIFSYAGTASLSKEMKSVPIDEMQIGDVFIPGGFPGHAVIIVDMVENEAGKRLFLIAQSYMPAQDIHLLKNKTDAQRSPWYAVDFGSHLQSPEWTFSNRDLKRFVKR